MAPTLPVRTLRTSALGVSLLVALATLLLLGGTTDVALAATNPLAGRTFYADRTAPASVQAIARTPQARWFGDWNRTSQVRAEVDRYVDAAAKAKAVPVLTLYAIPYRDCGGYSAGGLAGRSAYAAWVEQVARGIGTRRVVVVLEPDALASLDCLSSARRADRLAMLKAAVTRLAKSSATVVYLDAGHSHWLGAETAAQRLEAAGVSRARGFSLNVSNFQTTTDEVRYGERISGLVGGKHYVVDTSRNGRGPAGGEQGWCNPSGRGLGVAPTTKTAGRHADAYLWVKRPGESDGDCGRGEPAAGRWWQAYAEGLAARRA